MPMNTNAAGDTRPPRTRRVPYSRSPAHRRCRRSGSAVGAWYGHGGRDWLRERLGGLYDYGVPSTYFEVWGFTVAPPFRLRPFELSVDSRIARGEEYWCGRRIQVTLTSDADTGDAAAAVDRALADTPLAGLPVVDLRPSLSFEMIKKIREHPARNRLRGMLRDDGNVTWQAIVEQRPIR